MNLKMAELLPGLSLKYTNKIKTKVNTLSSLCIL